MGGAYKVMFINPKYDPNNKNSIQQWVTDPITDNWSDSNVR